MANELEYTALTGADLEREVEGLQGWHLADQRLVRTFEFGAFKDSVAFANRVAEVAERINHHPLIEINYKKVTLRLYTFKFTAITQADVTLAREINALAA